MANDAVPENPLAQRVEAPVKFCDPRKAETS
jgi:hypothetical protein